MLSLRWYDAEGCIESDEIDIVKQTPMLVLLLMVLQRFDKRMWGLTLDDPTRVKVGDKCYLLDSELDCTYELTGRRTLGANATPLPAADLPTQPQANGTSLFLKSSYAKCRDPKEPDIIDIIHERANSFLPEKYRKMVTDHVPTVIASEECESESTAIIRLLIKGAGGLAQLTEEDIMKESRVRMYMVTRKLQVLQNLPPSDFLRIFWELIRCMCARLDSSSLINRRKLGHYLLWQIGIAHKDISFNNLMYSDADGVLRGILNDYDLASIMEPGTRAPEIDGYECAGTMPFMALDLLRDRQGPFKRRYRHDLESFAWRLMWEMLKRHPRYPDCAREKAFATKLSHVSDIIEREKDFKREWRPYFLLIVTWFEGCLDYSRRMNHLVATNRRKFKSEDDKFAFRNEEEERMMDKEHLSPVIAAAKAADSDIDIEAIRDTTWLDVELSSKSIASVH